MKLVKHPKHVLVIRYKWFLLSMTKKVTNAEIKNENSGEGKLFAKKVLFVMAIAPKWTPRPANTYTSEYLTF